MNSNSFTLPDILELCSPLQFSQIISLGLSLVLISILWGRQMGIICILETWRKRNRYCNFPKDIQLLSGRTRLRVLSNEITQVTAWHTVSPQKFIMLLTLIRKERIFHDLAGRLLHSKSSRFYRYGLGWPLSLETALVVSFQEIPRSYICLNKNSWCIAPDGYWHVINITLPMSHRDPFLAR